MKRVPVHEQRIYLTPAELVKLGLGWDPQQFGRPGAAVTLAEAHLQDDRGGKRLCLVWRDTGSVSEISVDALREKDGEAAPFFDDRSMWTRTLDPAPGA